MYEIYGLAYVLKSNVKLDQEAFGQLYVERKVINDRDKRDRNT